MVWLSAHVFQSPPHDRLLVECLWPLAVALKQDGLVSSAFILRYWEHGPHVRVRTRCTAEQADTAGERLRATVQSYWRSTSSAVADRVAPLVDQVFAEADAVPMVVFVPYLPEWDRYGGRAGVAVAERHFELSSEIAMRLLARTMDNRRKRLGLALEVLRGTMRAFVDDPRDWCGVYARYWARYTVLDVGTFVSGVTVRYGPQRARMVAVGRRQSDETVRSWLSGLEATRTEYLLTSPANSEGPSWARLTDGKLGLLATFLHLFYNRLGLAPVEEAYLAQLASLAFGDGAW